MAESRISTIRALWAPKIVRYAALAVGAVAAYDGFSSQFDTPKLGEILGMSGTLLPWWGWLLVLQSIFVYALFEYVRRSQLPVPYDDTAFREKIDAELGDVGRQLKALLETVEPALKSQTEVNAAMRAATEQNEARIKTALASLAVVDDLQKASLAQGETVNAAKAEQHTFQARMVDWVGQLQRKIRFGLTGVDQGFAAILDREHLLKMAADIQDVGDELSGPTNGEALSEDWATKYGAWYKAVEAWARLAAKYREGVVARVFETPPQEYKGKWKAHDKLFPDSDAVHDYKTFRIILRNFQVERKDVDRSLRHAAFAHPSMKVKGDFEDDGDEELSLPPPPKVQT